MLLRRVAAELELTPAVHPIWPAERVRTPTLDDYGYLPCSPSVGGADDNDPRSAKP